MKPKCVFNTDVGFKSKKKIQTWVWFLSANIKMKLKNTQTESTENLLLLSLNHTQTFQLTASMKENDMDRDVFNAELYRALLNQNANKVKELCGRSEDRAMHRLTLHNDTVLHLAIYSKQVDLALSLLEDQLPTELYHKLTQANNNGTTILHEVATLRDERSMSLAETILERAPDLLSIRNNLGESVVFKAATYGKNKIFKFLVDKVSVPDNDEAMQPFIQRKDKTTILHIAILTHHFG